MVYIIYEWLKGEESFYHPFFEMVDSPLPTSYWSEDLLDRSDLQEFKSGLKDSLVKCD